MISNRVITILKNASGQVSTVPLTLDEEARIEQLAERLAAILDSALARQKATLA